MRVVVLGASGFLGRHVVPALVDAGHRVVALARHPPAPGPGVEPFAASALDGGALRRALAGSAAVVNLVGIHHPHGEQTFERLHVELVDTLVKAMRAAKVARLVQVSVLCARPDPMLAYHDSKFRGDALVEGSGLEWTVLRPAIVFGPDDAFTRRLRAQIGQRFTPVPGKGDALHAPVHVDDVAAAVARSLAVPGATGRVLPLTGPRTLTYAEILAELRADAGRWALAPRVPLGIVRWVARRTRARENPPIGAAQLAMITEGMAADSSASWALLGLSPRPFASGG